MDKIIRFEDMVKKCRKAKNWKSVKNHMMEPETIGRILGFGLLIATKLWWRSYVIKKMKQQGLNAHQINELKKYI